MDDGDSGWTLELLQPPAAEGQTVFERAVEDVEYFQRRLFAALGVPREYLERTKERAMNYLDIPCDEALRCRVRGKDGGGWRGDPGWIGSVTFAGRDAGKHPRVLYARIPHLEFSEAWIESIDYPTEGSLADTEISVDTDQGYFTFLLHRDDVHKLVPRSSTETKSEPAPVVDYAPDEGDRALIEMWETLLSPDCLQGAGSRALAVALVRQAVAEPGVKVNLRPFVRLSGSVAKILSSILQCSGLWRFATITHDYLVVNKPEPGADVYDWSRLCEQFHAPLEELRFEMYAVLLKGHAKE